VVEVVVVGLALAYLVQAALAAQALSSSPMLAHNNSVAVSSPLWAVTPFIHLLHQAHSALLHLCQRLI
jgi:hypothetical protein